VRGSDPSPCDRKFMKVSVIVCTFNRSASLARTLESLASSRLSLPMEYEVLVVDNNSTDATHTVALEFCRRHPGCFRYVFEAKSGKSNALNRGISEASGEILAFTDDDVIVDPNWIANLTVPLMDKSWAGSSGRTLPESPFQIPRWILPNRPHALAPLAIFDPRLDAGPLTVAPYGVNMAFLRSVVNRHGGFRTDLGPGLGAGAPHKSEDSEFGQRLLAGGERLRYEPSAVVYHSVPPFRLRRAYFLAWWYDKGRADCRADGCSLNTRWIIAGVPLRLLAKLARWTLAWLITMRTALRFERKINVWLVCGHITEYYIQAHRFDAQYRGRV
jgi:glucosyl-dolichyl phosphate glucuronosyltransferase